MRNQRNGAGKKIISGEQIVVGASNAGKIFKHKIVVSSQSSMIGKKKSQSNK